MADSDFSVKAIISAETSKFEKGMKDAQKSIGNVSKSIQDVSNLLKSAFSIAGIALSVKAVTDFGSACVKEADSANKSFNILKNTLQVTGATAWTSAEKMEQMSIEISDATNYSVGEIQDMQSVLLGFRNITGDTFREASDAITDMATVMGMDLKSAVQTVGKALDDPIKGLDSLRRQGFAFTDEQKEELAMLVKTGKQMEAQKIILDELNTTYGGAAKAAQSATAIWNHAMDSLKASIGNKLMPAVNASTEQMTKILQKITDFINSSEFNQIVIILTNVANKVKEVFTVILSYVDEVFTEIMEIFKKVDFSPFISVLDTLVGSVKKVAEIIKNKIDETIARYKIIVSEFMGVISGLDLKEIADFVNSVIDGFWFIYDKVQEIFNDVSDFIQKKIIAIWEKIKEIFNNSSKALETSETNIKSWKDFFYDELNTIFRYFQDLVGLVKALFKGDWKVAWEYAKLAIARAGDSMLTMLSTLMNAFPEFINGAIKGLNKFIEGINKVRNLLDMGSLDLIGEFKSTDLSEKTGLNKFISDTEKKIKELSGHVADYAIEDIKRVSESSKGAAQAIIATITASSNAAQNVSNETRKTFNVNLIDSENKAKEFWENLKKGWEKYKEDLEKDAEDWSNFFKSAGSAINDAFNETFEAIGEDLVEGGKGFEDYSSIAIQALAEVLKSLAAQLSATAALRAANYDYASAALAAAGAAAALVAAGTLKSVANNMKKTSEATKEASMSLKEFKERLENIWSGKSTSISVVASMRETDVIIKNSTNALKTAQAEYEKTVKQNNEKIKELEKSVKDRTKAQVAAAVLVPIFGAVAAAQTQKSIDKDKKKINELADEIVNANQKVLQAETKLRMANAQYLQGIRDTNESLEAQIAENRSVVSDYKTLYSSLNGYNKEMSRSKEIVTELAKVVKNELLVNTTSLLNEVYSSFGSLGKDIGETLMNSIVDGASKSDFMENMKKMIKQKILQLTIYTESFTKQIAQVGEKLVKSLMNDNEGLESVTKELSTLYDETAKKADKVNDLLNKAFNGYIDETADEVADKVDEFAEKLENLRSVVDNLKESLKTLRSQATGSFQNLVSNYASVSKELESLISAQQAVVDSLNKQHTDKYSVYKKNGIIYIPQDKMAEYRAELNQIKAAENELAALRKENSTLEVRLLRETQENLKKENSTLSEQISLYKSLYTLINVSDLSYKEIFTQSQINAIRNQLLNVQAELMNTATQIGSNIVSSIAKGATKADFMSSIKDYMKNQIVSLVVYSSGFESTLTELGRKMTKAISSGATNFTDLEKELSSLYDTVEKKVKTAYASLDKVFPDVNKNLKETSSSANTATASLSKLGEKIKSLKETLSDLGGDLADKLTNGLKSGLSKNDMLATMKDYIKDMIIQTVVYTDSMKSQIESVGKKIAQAINSGNYSDVLGAKEKIGSLYDTLTTKSKTALKWVEQLFPEMSKTVEKETTNVEKSLTKLESAVQSFKETIADLGGDIAGNLVDGLTNGLSQSDFLTNMKNWIKKMLVQSVVYTEQMKSQIEAIGKTISNAISGGFTETSMHEIRRDLSFIFEQASSKMSGIDKVLGGVFDGYAAGTENAKRGLHIVGEAGPELVRFRGGEQVYNNRDAMSMLGGGNKTNNFNVTFNNLQDTSAYAMMSQLKRYNKEMAINGVI